MLLYFLTHPVGNFVSFVADETEHYRLPKKSHSISSFVILDPVEDLNTVDPSAQHKAVQNVSEHSYTGIYQNRIFFINPL